MRLDRHHRFAKHRNRRRRYGELIHNDKNIEITDHDSHMSGKVSHLNEREFCRSVGVLKCEYCINYISGYDKPCLKYYGTYADNCREFYFVKTKYNIDKL